MAHNKTVIKAEQQRDNMSADEYLELLAKVSQYEGEQWRRFDSGKGWEEYK